MRGEGEGEGSSHRALIGHYKLLLMSSSLPFLIIKSLRAYYLRFTIPLGTGGRHTLQEDREEGITMQQNELYGLQIDGIKMEQNELYGLSADLRGADSTYERVE